MKEKKGIENSASGIHHLLFLNGAFFAANAAKNRAFRSKSSEAPMRFLWAFRSNPSRPTGFSRFARRYAI
ncbi:MAG: hypothetical protein LBK44_06895 [Spirochaetales bacterium]|nr:hypothetical protein [Spirochaetales bacterium]